MHVTNDLLFAQYFGRPFPTTSLPEPAVDLFELLPKVAHTALSPAFWPEQERLRPYRFEVGFIDDGRFNAGTHDASPGHGLVAFFAGVPLILAEALLGVAKQADLETALPLADTAGRLIVSQQKQHLVAPGISRSTRGDEIAARLATLLDRGPHGPSFETLAFSMLMYDMCARYIAMHECMHIILGHTAYVQRELGLSVLLEFERGTGGRLDPSFSQALEFIADRHTVHGVLNHYLTREDSLGARATVLRQAAVPERIFIMRILTTALVTLMHLFPVRNRSLTRRTGSHPHPYLRMRWLCRELTTEADEEHSLEGVSRPFAHWVACLGRNFIVPTDWLAASALDTQSTERGTSLTDASYSESIRQAHKWQTLLWKKYSPLYDGDGR